MGLHSDSGQIRMLLPHDAVVRGPEKFQGDFLTELSRHHSARTGIKGMVKHHLAWVAEDPQRAAYLFQCLEPEVFAFCREEQNQMTTAFFRKVVQWLAERAAGGKIRKMSFLEYYVFADGTAGGILLLGEVGTAEHAYLDL